MSLVSTKKLSKLFDIVGVPFYPDHYNMKYFLYCNLNSGISGDMFSASLLDMHSSEEKNDLIEEYYKDISEFAKNTRRPIADLKINLNTTLRKGIRASELKFEYSNPDKHRRSYKMIRQLILESKFNDNIREYALEIFDIIAKTEAKIHQQKIDDIHFHEVGSEDSILDIISAAYLYDKIGSPPVYSSPVYLGSKGEISFSHGIFPSTAPATLEILKNIPVIYTDEENEITTPTGAAIVKAMKFKVNSSLNENVYICKMIGYGAGAHQLKKRPNILRTSFYIEP